MRYFVYEQESPSYHPQIYYRPPPPQNNSQRGGRSLELRQTLAFCLLHVPSPSPSPFPSPPLSPKKTNSHLPTAPPSSTAPSQTQTSSHHPQTGTNPPDSPPPYCPPTDIPPRAQSSPSPTCTRYTRRACGPAAACHTTAHPRIRSSSCRAGIRVGGIDEDSFRWPTVRR